MNTHTEGRAPKPVPAPKELATRAQQGDVLQSNRPHTFYADAALHYVADGWSVLPLMPRGKRPHSRLAPRGFHSASSDPGRVRSWWRAEPRANIGLVIPRGVIVLDIDPRNAHPNAPNPPSLVTLLDEVEDALGGLPDSLTAMTGGGGLHLWFTDPAPEEPLAGKLPGVSGVDVLRHPRYVVAAPSVHPDTERRYEWARYPRAMERLPEGARRVLTPKPQAQQVQAASAGTQRYDLAARERGFASYLARTVATVTEGRRNRTLFMLACKAVEEGLSERVFDELRTAFTQLGLDHREIETTLSSARRHVGGKRGRRRWQ